MSLRLPCSTSLRSRLHRAPRTLLVALAALAVCLSAPGVSAQSSTNFSNPSSVINAGVPPMGGSAFTANAAVGQGYVGATSGSANFSIQSGFVPIAFLSTSGPVAPINSINLAAGGGHNCVILGGALKCWGLNQQGQQGLGNTFVFQMGAQTVTGLSSGVASVTAGYQHTCAVTVLGAAKCWGANGSGQLGIGAAGASQLTPVAVTGLGAGVVQLAAGNAHTCALMSNGGVKCWGKNTSGQLGDGSFTDRTLPVDVIGLSGVVSIVAGGAHSCALNSSGGLVCWGGNATGELGDGGASGASSNVPVGVSGLTSGVASVSASLQSTCVVTTGGGAKCWGADEFGAVGDGPDAGLPKLVPTDVSGLSSGVIAIAAGSHHACAIVTGGAVKCWGRANSAELGNDITIASPVPSDVPKIGVGNVAIVASQSSDPQSHTCVIASTGGVFCWGANYNATATAIPSTPVELPLPPVHNGILAGNGQVTVSFIEPEYRGTSVITGFTVNCGGHIATGPFSPITVTGLTNGVPVSCSMTATNASGVGITSLPSVSVTPSGLAPILSGGTAIVAFGPYTVGSTSAAKSVTFTNTGTAPLAITSATASGPFAITSNTCASVAPAASCALQLTFTPPAVGDATGILTITSNASLGSTVIDLRGTGVARTPDSYLYIPNENGDLGANAVGTVSVVDAAAGAVVATIPVGLRPSSSAVNNAGTMVYVANSVGNSVSVISTATNTVVATIPVTGAYGVAVSPADTRVYVNSGSTLQVIDAATNTVVATVPHTFAGAAIAVSPSGKKVYVVEQGVNSVAVIDAQTNTFIKRVSVLIGATGIAVKPDGSEVWVVNNGNNSVSVIKTDTDTLHPATTVNGTFGGLFSPSGVVFNPSGTRAYISQYGSTKLTVVDTSNFAFVQEVSMRYRGWNGDVSADGSRVYVLNFYSEDAINPLVEDKTHGNLTILDAASNSILTVVPVGNTPKTLGRMTAWGTGGLVAPAITSAAPATAAVNISYTHTFAGSGTAPYFWSISAGTLPPGLTFSTTTGVLSGTPTTVGSYNFTVQLANGVGTNVTQSVAFTVGNPPAVLSASPTSIDFGPYTVGVTSAIKTVTITNTGSTALTVSSATTTESFAVVSHNCAAVVTAATCQVQLTFSPATIGSFSGTLSIISNATGSPHSIALAGSAVARAPDSFIYIPNENADLGASTVGTVSVVDAVAGEVVATIPVGLRPSSSAVNNAGTLVYVANFGSNSVSVISTATHSVVATIAVAGAYGVAVSPADTRLYVNSGANLQVIDTATNAIIASVPHTVSGGAIAVSPSGKKVYVGEGGFNSVAVIDAQTNTYIKRVDAHVGVTGVAVTPDGSEMWVVNNGFNSVNIIKTDTDTPHPATTTTGTFGGLSSPSGVVFNPAGTRAYISQYGSSKLTVVDTSTFAILGNVSMKYRGWNGDVSADGSRIYVLNLYSADAVNPAVEDRTRGNLTVVDAATSAILKVIPLGNNPKTYGRMTAWGPGALVAPAITSGTPPAGALTTAYTHTFTGTGTAPVRWSLGTGTLPAGLTLNANTGVLAGTPTAAGVFTFTVQLANGVGSNATQNVTLIIGSSGVPTVPGSPVIGVASAGNGQASIAFTAPAVTGGTAITGYTASCSEASQVTRTASGSVSPIIVTNLTNFIGYTCTVTATNAIGTSAPSAGVVVTPLGAPTIVSSATADGTTGTPFSYQIATNIAATSYSTSGTLPTGVTLNTGTGLISGTPTQAGTFNVTVSATNAGGTGSLPIVITIASGVLQYTVTPSAGAGGSISPATPQLVTSGATTTFTITPDAGYSVSVGGTCGGSLIGSTYTTNAITADCTVAATFSLLPVLQSVVSRKVHGPAGPFDVSIDHTTPITGHVDTDPRAIGSGFTLIFTFDRAITTAGPVTSIDRFGDQSGVASAAASGNTIVVTLIGVPNNQRVQVTLSGVNGNGVATASMGFLVGDVGNNRSVSSRDISAIKARRNRPVDINTFRADVNLSGNIDNADVTMAKSRAGLKLP